MAVLYLYAIAESLKDISDLRGIRGEKLEIVPVSGAVVVAGAIEQAPAVEVAALKAQDALIRVLHERAAALLPMRFGTTATEAESVGRLIAARTGILDRLAAVQGCEQMITRVVDQVGATHASPDHVGATHVLPDPALPGTRYLQSRAALHKPSPELLVISRAAAGLQRDVRIQPARHTELHGTVYHLIERGRAQEYRSVVEAAAAELRGVRVIVTGPLPPYAFA